MVLRSLQILWLSALSAGFLSTSVLAQAEPGPGDALLAPEEGATMFLEICLDNRADFKAAQADLVGWGFNPAQTGTWYDDRHDVSFKIQDFDGTRYCSMVFSDVAEPYSTMIGFSEPIEAYLGLNRESGPEFFWITLPDGSEFVIEAREDFEGRTYFRAEISEPRS